MGILGQAYSWKQWTGPTQTSPTVTLFDSLYLRDAHYSKLRLVKCSKQLIKRALSQLRIYRPVYIKDTQWAKKNDGRKISYDIISRLGVTGAQRHPNGKPKIRLSSKVAKFAR